MTELLTAAQMRAIEQAAIDSGEVTGLELMERAGRGVVEAIFEEWPELAKTDHKAVVLCGPGNNGGDGFVVARLLKDWGWEVAVFLYGDREKLPPDAKVNCEQWLEKGEVRNLEFASIYAAQPFDLRVDAVFGSGLKRPPTDELIDAFHATWAAKKGDKWHPRPHRVAVDCPSCLDLDTGKPFLPDKWWEGDVHIEYYADLTVSFHRLKIGHVLVADWNYSNKTVVADIGLNDISKQLGFFETTEPPTSRKSERPKLRVRLLEGTDCGIYEDEWPATDLMKFGDHKYQHGHALILSGPFGHGGAARLAARGALRIGAGLVSVACPPDALAEHAAQLNAIMVRGFDGADGLAEVLSDDRISSVTLGPGLGLSEATKALVEISLKSQKKCVLDADALSIYRNNENALFALLHEDVVLTPHGGEFARLFPDIAEKLAAPAVKGPAYSKVDATREAAKRAGCVVLFKGADTVIAAPNGVCSINSAHYERAAPWLATAGSGDVLAGFIGGLMARGFGAMQAAETAAWLHVECARSFGPGLIAEDLPEELPKVFRSLEI
jgi:ADP-dependent NAD(P)H-hydrate dehydratase / NAD(P)H-hydrate epimerase